jgi:anaerobic dimethyl sulfoxide reductase subunit A
MIRAQVAMDQPASPVDRRCFIKWSLLVGSPVASLPAFGLEEVRLAHEAGAASQAGTRIVRAGCPSHNCGGRCLLKLHVENGTIVRIETDDRPTDTVEAPQLRACIRGRAYRRRQYHPDRLLRPLKRVGRRGEGDF